MPAVHPIRIRDATYYIVAYIRCLLSVQRARQQAKPGALGAARDGRRDVEANIEKDAWCCMTIANARLVVYDECSFDNKL
eukprot:6190541-Pleurochrysis_carterae.AAC.4